MAVMWFLWVLNMLCIWLCAGTLGYRLCEVWHYEDTVRRIDISSFSWRLTDALLWLGLICNGVSALLAARAI